MNINPESIILQIASTNSTSTESSNIETATIALAIATIALVGITAYYALQTRNTVNAVKISAELSIRPHLKGTINMMGPVAINLMISNVGNGPAQTINLQYSLENVDDSGRNWNKPLLMSKDKEEFFIPTSENTTEMGIDYFKNNPSILHITGEYYDLLGKKYSMNDSINITEYVAQFQQTQIRYKEDPLEKIANYLEKIKDELRRR